MDDRAALSLLIARIVHLHRPGTGYSSRQLFSERLLTIRVRDCFQLPPVDPIGAQWLVGEHPRIERPLRLAIERYSFHARLDVACPDELMRRPARAPVRVELVGVR